MKLLVISDTHGELERTKEVIRKHADADLFLDLGDVGFELKELDGFIIVKGNHDASIALPREKILEIEQRRILCIHGDVFEKDTVEEVMAMNSIPETEIMEVCMKTLYRHIVTYAKRKECDTVFFGHTHVQMLEEQDGILILNPGSLAYGLMGEDHSYAMVDIKGKQVNVTFCDAS